MIHARPKSRRWLVAPALVAVATLGVAACSSGSSGSGGGTSSTSLKKGGSIVFAIDQDVSGFNVLNLTDNQFVLAEMVNQVLPTAYIVNNKLQTVLDTDYVTSAKVTSTSPQTIVYNLNPKAVWSDGTPFSANDFIYSWESQSGNPKFKDVGGKPFQPAGTAGYSQIQSVTGSNGGKTVTVVFSKPFGDWQSLFGDMLPAHIASKVGFNTGYQNFGPSVQVSGGPYEIASYAKGQDLVEVPNPKWWGAGPYVSKITYRIIPDDTAMPAAAQNGEAQIVSPAAASLAFVDSMKAAPNFTVDAIAGLEFQHMDFNESNFYLAKHDVRQAIIYGTNRQEIITRLVDPILANQAPLANRIYMPTQPQYSDTSNGLGVFDPAKAKALLTGLGYKLGSDGYFQPTDGPLKGKDLSLNISTTAGNTTRAEIEQLFQADMKAIGIKINIVNYSAAQLFGVVGPKGQFDIIQFAWVSSPFASGNESIYCSYTNAAVCGSNWDHYADPQVDALLTKATQTVDPTQSASLYNQVDTLLWKDAVTLPLFQSAQLWAYSNNYVNILPNASSSGITWNAQDWGAKAS